MLDNFLENNKHLTMVANKTENSPPCYSTNYPPPESKTNLIVNYLPQAMGQDDILSLFSRVAEVDFCKLIRDKVTGESLGYAFVNYRGPEGAERAVQTLNGLRLQNKVIKVSYARPSSEAIKGANVYVSGLPLNTTPEQIYKLFSPYGTIINSRILTDKMTGKSKGVGFVRFDKRSEAEKAITSLDGTTPDGYKEAITLKFANHPNNKTSPSAPGTPLLRRAIPMQSTPATRSPSPGAYITSRAVNKDFPSIPDWCLFIYNLTPDADEATLWQLFGPIGGVRSVRVARHQISRSSKGYGFVRMTSYEHAISAIQTLNGSVFRGRVLHVSFKTRKN